MIMRSTDVKSALRSRQRGFLLNPHRFGGSEPPSVPTLAQVQAIFAGSTGGLYDLTDASTLYTSSSFTTQASVNGVVLGVKDVSGLGNDLSYTAGNALHREGGSSFSGCYMEWFGDANTHMLRRAISFPSTSGLTIIQAVDPSVTDGCPIGYDSSSNRVTQGLRVLFETVPRLSHVYFMNGTTTATTIAQAVAGCDGKIVSSSRLSTTSGIIRMNGVEVHNTAITNTYVVKTGGKLTLGGQSAGTSVSTTYNKFGGNMYCVAAIGRALLDAEIVTIENYMAHRAGITF